MSAVDDETIQLKLEWSMLILREAVYAGQVGGGGRLSSKARYVIYVVLFGALGFIGVRSGNYFALGFPVILIAALYLQRWYFIRALEAELDAPMRRGPTAVTLGPNGIDMTHPMHTWHVEWPVVLSTVECPLAYHLMLSSRMSLPIPYDTLPEGVTREVLHQRVEAWRSGGVF